MYPKAILVSLFVLASCGFNLFSSMTSKDSDRYHLDAAKIHIDRKEYADAESSLEKVEHNSEEKVLLQVSAKLGKSGLSMWDILLEAIEKSSSSTGGSGVEKLFNLFSDTFFGTGQERLERLNALDESVQLLKSVATSGDKLDNLRCFLTGIFILPVVNDGSAAILDINSTLQSIGNTVSGTGATAEECSGLSAFQTAMETLSRVQGNLQFILEQISGCSLLDFLNNSSAINEVANRMRTFSETADKGCPAITCTGAICDALNFPCVDQLLDTEGAVADNGIISACELVYNCRNGDCF